MKETADNVLSSAAIKRQVRFVVYINENEFKTEWASYNPVEMANKTQALVQNGHPFMVETK